MSPLISTEEVSHLTHTPHGNCKYSTCHSCKQSLELFLSNPLRLPFVDCDFICCLFVDRLRRTSWSLMDFVEIRVTSIISRNKEYLVYLVCTLCVVRIITVSRRDSPVDLPVPLESTFYPLHSAVCWIGLNRDIGWSTTFTWPETPFFSSSTRGHYRGSPLPKVLGCHEKCLRSLPNITGRPVNSDGKI